MLAGIIAGLIAQGATIEETTIAGAVLHGLVGDASAEKKSEYTLFASDIVTYLSEVLVDLTGGA